jgi:hypothetical protein
MAKYGEIEEYAGMVHATGSVTETANSPGLDCKNVEQVAVIGLAGTALVPSDTIDIKVQESDDDAATDPYTDVTGAAFAQLVDTDDGKVVYGKIRTNVAGRKRWLRAVVVNGGTLTGSGSCILIAYNRGGHTPPAVNALPATEFSV